jgi:protoporphyrin/coproporphyrin ferrochelatase
MDNERKAEKGVVLCNMGGPDTLADVRPFLTNLFSDRQIIRLGPPFMQKFLAWLIARRRAPKSRAIYALIGGGSPLKAITGQQAAALEKALADDGSYAVAFAMRYWPPLADEVIASLLARGVKELTVVSLYPHYSRATTGSSFAAVQESLRRFAPEMPCQWRTSWPTRKEYIAALAGNIAEGLQRFATSEVTVVYSAHSLPTSFIAEGDPYVRHLGETIAAVERLTSHPGRLCYQSRSGPVAWLSPSTPEMLNQLAAEGCRNVLMVPISFVSDHIETLYEIAILYRKQATGLGMRLEPCASLNTNPLFIEALRQLVLRGETG